MAEDFTLRIGFDDFDFSQVGMTPVMAGTDSFSTAVTDFFCRQFEAMGGSARVIVDDQARDIRVTWSLKPGSREPKEIVLELLRAGQFQRAIPLLWTLIKTLPSDPDAYYNMGVAKNELGEFAEATLYLQQAVKLAPKYVDALAALGLAQIRTGDTAAAAETLKTAVSVDPSNVYALKNLSACLLNLGRFEEAEPILRRAVHVAPEDVQSAFGLAQALEELGRGKEADTQYQRVLDIGGNHPVVEQAEVARTRIAERTMRDRGGVLRPDVFEYCTAALNLFATLPPEKIHAIGFEIAIFGQSGLDINNAHKKYELKELDGKFSGLKLCAYMYVAFQQIAPGTDVGIDFSREYAAAMALRG